MKDLCSVHRSMEIIATRNASLAADLREALKQHTLKDSPSSKDAPLSEAAAAPGGAEEDADEEDDDADVDMEDETDEEKGMLGIVWPSACCYNRAEQQPGLIPVRDKAPASKFFSWLTRST